MKMRGQQFQRLTLIATVVIGQLALFFVPSGGRPALMGQLSEFKTRAWKNDIQQLNKMSWIS